MSLSEIKGKISNSIVVNYIKRRENLLIELLSMTDFLDSFYDNVSLKQRVFHFVHNHFEIVKCKYCNNAASWNSHDSVNFNHFYYGTKNYKLICSNQECLNIYNFDKIKKQWQSMNVSNFSQLESWKKTKIKNCLEKTGKEWFCQTEEFKIKVKKNSLEKYGVEHYTKTEHVQNKKKKTCIKKYGIDCILKDRNRIEEGMLKKYGVKNPAHSSSIFVKNNLGNWKNYILPSGKQLRIQGYENFAINLLLTKYKEEDLVIGVKEIDSLIGKILYQDNNKKIHRYYPDIYLIPENKIIEVKSVWTFNKDIAINLLKEKAVLEKGYLFEFMIFDHNGKEISIDKNEKIL